MSALERRPQLLLTDADFDAYLPERATSTAFGRPRVDVRQRMLAFAKKAARRLEAMGVPLDVSATDDHPTGRNGMRVDAQRVFLWRDAAARADLERVADHGRPLAAVLRDPTPYARHTFLGVKIDASAVEVGVELAPEAEVDVANLRARLADPGRALELAAALEALPEQFVLRLAGEGDDARREARRLETGALRDLLGQSALGRGAIWLGWRVPRDVAVEHAALVDEQLEDAIVALAPLYRLLAWAPDNDLVGFEREEAPSAARGHHIEVRTRDRAAVQKSAKRAARKDAARGREARGRDDERDDEVAPEATPVPPAARLAAPLPRAARPILRRRPPARVTDIDPSVPIDKGVRVCVLRGPFEGKVGVVQEMDGKGHARVMLGLLAMWLDASDLVAAREGGRGRPVLASSHRKPTPKP